MNNWLVNNWLVNSLRVESGRIGQVRDFVAPNSDLWRVLARSLLEMDQEDSCMTIEPTRLSRLISRAMDMVVVEFYYKGDVLVLTLVTLLSNHKFEYIKVRLWWTISL